MNKLAFLAFLLLFAFPVMSQDTVRFKITSANSQVAIPEVEPGDEVVLLIENRTGMQKWFLSCGNWARIDIRVVDRDSFTGGWKHPLHTDIYRILFGANPQITQRFFIFPRASSVVRLRFVERFRGTITGKVQVNSWPTVRNSRLWILDPLLAGSIGILILFNLLLFYLWREKSYLFFALGHLFFLLYAFVNTGYIMQELYRETLFINLRVTGLCANVFYLTYGVFMHYFFGASAFGKRLLRLLALFIGLASLIHLLPIPLEAHYELILYPTQGFVLAIYVSLIWNYYRTHRLQFFNVLFLLGIGVFVTGGLLTNLVRVDVLPEYTWLYTAEKTGIMLEALLLSTAVAGKAMFQQKQHEQLQATFNQDLQTQVTQKTQELNTQNQLLEKAVEDRELLLSEVHHRVKNNLQLVSSLLDMQSRTVPDPQSQQALSDSKARVHAMALVHHKLYAGEELSALHAGEYLQELVGNVSVIYESTPVEVATEADDFSLPQSAAVSLGLVITELVTNAYKHAFGDGAGKIDVSLRKQGSEVILSVVDNGKGWNGDRNGNGLLGTLIIESMAKQLNGTFSIQSEEGLAAHFTFPIA